MHSIVTIVAKYFIIFPVLLAVYVWLKLNPGKKKQFIIFGLLAAVVTYGLAKIGGALYYDPRPFVAGHFTPYFSHANDNGFPSDHTLFGSLLALVSLKYNRRLGYLALALALAVGLARAVAGVHHVVDIIGALVLAAAGTGLSAWALAIWSKKSPTAQEP